MNIFKRIPKHVHVWQVKEKQVIDSPFKEAMKKGTMEKISGHGAGLEDIILIHYKCISCSEEKVVKL